MKKFSLFLVFFLIFYDFYGQPCSIKLSGKVLDLHDNSSLDDANIYLLESKQGASSDSLGNFVVENICPGKYHIIISHIGCKDDTIQMEISQTIVKNFYLEHHWEELQEIVTTATYIKKTEENKLSKDDISKNSGKDLGNVLKSINGVNLIKSGNNINKPVLHGLYGSRITIVRDNSRLESQDWGMEHAPEINPYDAASIQVNDDLSGIRYAVTALNGNIEISSNKYKYHKSLKADAAYSLQSNGWKNTVSAQLQQGFDKGIAYKIAVLYAINGDAHAPHYNLTNTAGREGNVSAGISLFKKDWKATLEYAYFNQHIGILRSAHIGNITDLLNAIQADKPLIIEPFSFQINNSKQKVNHHTLNAELIKIKNSSEWILRYNFQQDRRKEYDIRRGGRSDIPALDMRLWSEQFNGIHKFSKTTQKDIAITLENGIFAGYKDNTNNYETEIKPLIPDYQLYNAGAYHLSTFTHKNIKSQIAARYEYTRFLPAFYDAAKMLQKPVFNFNNYGAGIYLSYTQPKNYFILSSSLTANSRFPNPGELYSNGLHHGAAVMEYGNPDLQNEHNMKFAIGLQCNYKQYLHIELNPYVNYSKNYIYYYPLGYPVLTIRGAFPAFKYANTNALLYGADFYAKSNFYKYFTLWMKSSLVRGRNLNTKDNLIYMPSDQLSFGLDVKAEFKHSDYFYGTINTETAFKQTRIPSDITDYKAAPPTYTLLNIEAGYSMKIKTKNTLQFSVSAENAANKSYRNYLNRFRYYTDEPGANIIFRIKYAFE